MGEPADLNNYLLGQVLGEGTFGKVHLATHLLSGQTVAVKVLEKARIIRSKEDMARVQREVSILKSLRHPHVIRLLDLVETPACLYLVMEHAHQGELFQQIVDQGTLSEATAAKHLLQLLSGVHYLHTQHGVVHRDLKPENLLLDHRNELKIVDFGLSNIYADAQMLQTACGSPCYAAPEMIAGLKYQPALVDVWSCGVVLYAMVNGCLPFQDDDQALLYAKIQQGVFYWDATQHSPELTHLVHSILQVDATKRLDIQAILHSPWIAKYYSHEQVVKALELASAQMHFDQGILEHLQTYKMTNLVQDLKKGVISHNTASYYLFLEKQLAVQQFTQSHLKRLYKESMKDQREQQKQESQERDKQEKEALRQYQENKKKEQSQWGENSQYEQEQIQMEQHQYQRQQQQKQQYIQNQVVQQNHIPKVNQNPLVQEYKRKSMTIQDHNQEQGYRQQHQQRPSLVQEYQQMREQIERDKQQQQQMIMQHHQQQQQQRMQMEQQWQQQQQQYYQSQQQHQADLNLTQYKTYNGSSRDNTDHTQPMDLLRNSTSKFCGQEHHYEPTPSPSRHMAPYTSQVPTYKQLHTDKKVKGTSAVEVIKNRIASANRQYYNTKRQVSPIINRPKQTPISGKMATTPRKVATTPNKIPSAKPRQTSREYRQVSPVVSAFGKTKKEIVRPARSPREVGRSPREVSHSPRLLMPPGVTVFDGSFAIDQLSGKSPVYLSQEVVRVCQSLGYWCRKESKFQIKVSRENVLFLVEVAVLQGFPQMSLLLYHLVSGDPTRFTALSALINRRVTK